MPTRFKQLKHIHFSFLGRKDAQGTQKHRATYGDQHEATKRAHPDFNQGPADLQSAALTTEL